MWFTRKQFEICNELRMWGLEPRFEPGDVVARGFADLGFEEFQVLPGEKLLSLTAGTSTALPADHQGHFFWIPSIDECVSLLERAGVTCLGCDRVDAREWKVEAHCEDRSEEQRARALHEALLSTVREVYKARFKKSE